MLQHNYTIDERQTLVRPVGVASRQQRGEGGGRGSGEQLICHEPRAQLASTGTLLDGPVPHEGRLEFERKRFV